MTSFFLCLNRKDTIFKIIVFLVSKELYNNALCLWCRCTKNENVQLHSINQKV